VATVRDSFHKVVRVSDAVSVDVDTGSGDIVIQRGTVGTVDVTSSFQVRAASEDEARKIAAKIKDNPPVQVWDNVVRVGDLEEHGRGWLGCWQAFWGPQVTMDFVISVPADARVALDSGSGDQRVKGIKGPVEADTGSGDIEVEEIETDVEADTGSGKITAVGVRGDIDADTGSGDVVVANIGGSANIDTGGGNVRATQVRGDVSADTGSGNVVLEEIAGRIDADTGSGQIEVVSAIGDGMKWVLDTGSGNVHLKLPRDARFELQADTGSGRIVIDGFEIAFAGEVERDRVVGRVGRDPTAKIHVDTSSGNIRIGCPPVNSNRM